MAPLAPPVAWALNKKYIFHLLLQNEFLLHINIVSSTRLFKKLIKFNTGFLRAKKVHIHLKFKFITQAHHLFDLSRICFLLYSFLQRFIIYY